HEKELEKEPEKGKEHEQHREKEKQEEQQEQHHKSLGQQVPLKVLTVGSAYEDTILYVDKFPHEDGKQRAQRVERRRGGNSGNTLTVLSQFPLTNCHFMSSMASKEASV